MGRVYPEALRSLVMEETGGQLSTIESKRRQIYAAGGGGVNKLIASRFSPAAIGGRFAGVSGAGFEVGVLPQERLLQLARQKAEAKGINPTARSEERRVGKERRS